MIAVFNRYLHGYVAGPVYLALEEKGVFQLLENAACSVDQLCREYGANAGHMSTALGIFESFGWLHRDERDRFTIKPNMSPLPRNFPRAILAVYRIPIEILVFDPSSQAINNFFEQLNLSGWNDRITRKWDLQDERVIDFLDSGVMLPLLYFLKQRCSIDQERLQLSGLPTTYHCEIQKFFEMQDLGEPEGGAIRLSPLGNFMMESCLNAGVTLSYHPLLAQIDTLIFGGVDSLFQHQEHESHIARKLNVIGSGTQHTIFFEEFLKYLQSFMTHCPDASVLEAIVDMGCGDGALLQACSVLTESAPQVMMVGVDYNDDALREAEKVLQGIPNLLIKGDVGEPQDLATKLSGQGIDKKHVLHIRSFLDHNRFLKPPQGGKDLERKQDIPYSGIFVDQKGGLIPAYVVVQSLVEYFKEWAAIIGKFGLVTLEVFCLETAIVKKYLDDTESLHFDAYHRFSGQLLVEADVYLMSAAEAGLFPLLAGFKKYPSVLPYTRISRQHFIKKTFSIRQAHISDFADLINIENETMPEHLRASHTQLKVRTTKYPQGQYILVIDSKIAGVLYTQRINKEEEIYKETYKTVESFHDPGGSMVQLISIHILPEYQGMGLSYELLQFGLLHSLVRSGVKKAVGISRCASYKRQSNISLQDYIQKKNKLGHPVDPVLNFHHEMGAVIIGIVPGYREQDTDNEGYGVHIEYNLHRWLRKKQQR